MSTDCVLQVNGTAYSGWTSIKVKTGVDRLSGDFDLGVVELWSTSSSPRLIPKGSSFYLALEGTKVMTGFTNCRNVEYDERSHSVTIKGRDKAQDLVDCSAIHQGGQWFNQTMDQIVADMIAPHGVKLTVATDVGKPFPKFAISAGESIFEAIDRMARQRGVLVMSDGLGGISIAQPSGLKIKTPLVLGQNIKRCSATDDDRDRFYEYIALAHLEFLQPDGYIDAIGAQGEAFDKAIRKNRVKLIHAEEGFDTDTFQKRAQWEAAYRYGHGLCVDYTVTGWSHADGLWIKDRMVFVNDPYADLKEWLYIAGVTYGLDEKGGKTTDLHLMHEEAFQLVAIPEAQEQTGE